MAFAFMTTTGLALVTAELASYKKGANISGSSEWWVGTVVPYAPFTEFGTRSMPARPWFRTAIKQTAAMTGVRNTALSPDKMWAALVTPELAGRDYAGQVAFQLLRNAKKQIRILHVIDSGNLRGSIAIGESRGKMRARSRLLDRSRR